MTSLVLRFPSFIVNSETSCPRSTNLGQTFSAYVPKPPVADIPRRKNLFSFLPPYYPPASVLAMSLAERFCTSIVKQIKKSLKI